MPDVESTVIEGEITAPVQINAEITGSPVIEVQIVGSGPPGPEGPQGPVGPAGSVLSVNGEIGDVELDAEKVGALPDDISIAKGTHSSGTSVIIGRLDDQTASGNYSVAMGRENVVSAGGDVAFGRNNNVSASFSFASGYGNVVQKVQNSNSQCAAAIGDGNIVDGYTAFAEGYYNQALKQCAHAEGQSTIANANQAHSEGYGTTASGYNAHAENDRTIASGVDSHAEGLGTIANHQCQHVFGRRNIPDPSAEASSTYGNYVEIVGNGQNENELSNARTLDWDGNEVLAGKLTLGAGPSADMDAATKQYADSLVNQETFSSLVGFSATGPAGATEKVALGTKILNKVCVARTASQVGFYYDPGTDTLKLYNVVALQNVGETKRKYFYMARFANDQSVMTLDGGEGIIVNEINAGSLYAALHTFRLAIGSISTTPSKQTTSFRLAAVLLDDDENITNVFYGAQYFYTYSSGAVSRALISTPAQDKDFVVDIGLFKNTASVTEKFGTTQRRTSMDTALEPLVSTDQPTGFEHVVDDSIFDNASYGYSLCAVLGDFTRVCGPTIYKAEPPLFESGTDGTWTWRKWSDGLLELQRFYNGAPNTGTHYTTVNGFYGYYVSGFTFPSDAQPISNDYSIMADWAIGTGFSIFCGTVSSKAVTGFTLYALSTASGQSTVKIGIYIRAKWK